MDTQKSPCTKDCPKRCAKPNCHMTCKEYLDFRLWKDQVNDNRRKANQVASDCYEVHRKGRCGSR